MPTEAPAENIEEPRPAPRPARPNAVRQRNTNLQTANDNAEEPVGRIRQMRDNFGQKVVETAEGFRDKLRSILRFEDPEDAPEGNLLLPPSAPINAVGNFLDGTALNCKRRTVEVAEPLGSTARAAYRTITRPIPGFNLADTVRRPLKYLANPLRIISSVAHSVSNVITAIPKIPEEVAHRAVKRPLQNLGKIPFTTTLSKVAGFVGGVAGKVREGLEWVRDRTTVKFDNWVASKQE